MLSEIGGARTGGYARCANVGQGARARAVAPIHRAAEATAIIQARAQQIAIA